MGTITKRARKLADELSKAAERLITPSMISELLTLAQHYAKIQEDWCNVAMDDAQTERTKAKEAKLEARIREIAAGLPGVHGVKFTGDPRGYCVRLHLDSKRYNTWGGVEDGYGVA